MDEPNVYQEQPEWAKRQETMMTKMMDLITTLRSDVLEVKDQVSQANLQAGLAQSLAEEAIELMSKR